MPKKVAIQGYEGSFHQIAALEYLGADTQVIPCDTFREVAGIAADTRLSDGGFMAIENSIAGSILPNYGLLQRASLTVKGEIYLQIDQHLLALPGVSLDELTEVHSHPMALLQCMDFLSGFPTWKLVESTDTALSAKELSANRKKSVAVIGSALAAKLFGLQILSPQIQSNKNNYTRFLFVTPGVAGFDIDGPGKTSLYFTTDHSRGSLAKVLSSIADHSINLSKLQSVPIPEEEWKYGFHADMEWNSKDQLVAVLANLRAITNELNVLGNYQKGKTV